MTKVPITERALVQRINRKLADRHRVLKSTRGGRALAALGQHYVLDLDTNAVVLHHIEIEAFGRELEALATWETL